MPGPGGRAVTSPANPPVSDKKRKRGRAAPVCNQIEDAMKAAAYAEALTALRITETVEEDQ